MADYVRRFIFDDGVAHREYTFHDNGTASVKGEYPLEGEATYLEGNTATIERDLAMFACIGYVEVESD